MKLICMSVYTDDSVVPPRSDGIGDRLPPEPISTAALAKKVRECRSAGEAHREANSVTGSRSPRLARFDADHQRAPRARTLHAKNRFEHTRADSSSSSSAT